MRSGYPRRAFALAIPDVRSLWLYPTCSVVLLAVWVLCNGLRSGGRTVHLLAFAHSQRMWRCSTRCKLDAAAWRTPGNVQLQAATGGCGAARPPSVSLQWPSWVTLNQQGAVVPSSRRAHRAARMQLTNGQRPMGPRHGEHLSKWWHVVRERQFPPKLVRCGTLPVAIG